MTINLKGKNLPKLKTAGGKLYVAGRLVGELIEFNIKRPPVELLGSSPFPVYAAGEEITFTIRCRAVARKKRK